MLAPLPIPPQGGGRCFLDFRCAPGDSRRYIVCTIWLAWLAGCGGGGDEIDPVYVAPVVRAPIPAPERLTGPVRFRADGLGTGRAQHLLCTGAGDAREALLGALERSWAGDELAPLDTVLHTPCAADEWRGWVRERLAENDDLLGAYEPLWAALLDSDDPEVGAFVVGAAPDLQTLHYLEAHQGPYHPRLLAVVGRLLRDDPYMARYALDALALIDAPEAEQALLELHAHAPRSLRDEVALSLYGRPSEAARRLHREACGRVVDDRCTWSRPDPLASLPEAVAAGEEGGALLARYPQHRGAIVEALARCVRDGAPSARRCARSLAEADRARAVEPLASGGEAVADLHRALISGPEGVAVALEACGFAEVPAAPTAVGALVAAGAALPLRDPGGWPPQNDRLAYELAALVGAPDLAFEQVVPSFDAPTVEGRQPTIALYAYADGWRARALAAPLGAIDVDAVVGLLNAVLDQRGAEVRLVVDLDREHAIAGSPDALSALAGDGWVLLSPPPTAEATADTGAE
jgi:hypothetical protein